MKIAQKQSYSNSGKGVAEKTPGVRNFKQVHLGGDKNYKIFKKQFEQLQLKSKINKNDQYLVDLRDMNLNNAKNNYEVNYENEIICNRIGGTDGRPEKENIEPLFGEVWKKVLEGNKQPPSWRQGMEPKNVKTASSLIDNESYNIVDQVKEEQSQDYYDEEDQQRDFDQQYQEAMSEDQGSR